MFCSGRLMIPQLLALVAHAMWVPCAHTAPEPVVTVVLVVDQFAYSYVPKIAPYFKYGLKELLAKGIVYHQAFHAHGVPETTTGHHALGTGTLPKDHGGVLNQWLLPDGSKVAYDADASINGAQQTGPLQSKSCCNTQVDGLSDQFVMASGGKKQYKVWALSLKSYPAIIMASRLGKALWFDESKGTFAGSLRHFSRLPDWVATFNQRHGIGKKAMVPWTLAYPKDDSCYQFPAVDNYRYAGMPSLVQAGRAVFDHTKERPFELFVKTPASSQLLLKLAAACVRATLCNRGDRLLLWVSLSNLDLAGHFFGPHSRECLDTLYHLDRQIGQFMQFCRRYVGQERCLFVLTSDHGICPIPEVAHELGCLTARRIIANELIKTINGQLEAEYGVRDLLLGYEPTYFVLNRAALADKSAEEQQVLLQAACTVLRAQPGIKHVWTRQQLADGCFAPNSHEYYYQQQLYGDRMGDIIVQTDPYCLLTHYPTGTSHSSPYDYDTQVPLVLYQRHWIQRKQLHERVIIPQLSPTLARILNIAPPSASTMPVLPGVWEDIP